MEESVWEMTCASNVKGEALHHRGPPSPQRDCLAAAGGRYDPDQAGLRGAFSPVLQRENRFVPTVGPQHIKNTLARGSLLEWTSIGRVARSAEPSVVNVFWV